MQNNKEKIIAGIVTYNANPNLLLKNIKAIIEQVDEVIIIDNGSSNISEWCGITDNPNVNIILNGENKGIATALNQLCEYADEKGYSWILTLDQDSISSENLVKDLFLNIEDDVAIIAPNIIYKNNEKYSIKKSGKQVVQWVITSASLTRISAWKKVNGFDERLFIDGVDRDFGIRVSRAGYKVIIDYDVSLLHELGNLECRRKMGRTIYVTNHSALRKYYMSRNSIYLDKKLKIKESPNFIFKLILKTVVYEDNKYQKLRYIMKGIRDGFRMNLNT